MRLRVMHSFGPPGLPHAGSVYAAGVEGRPSPRRVHALEGAANLVVPEGRRRRTAAPGGSDPGTGRRMQWCRAFGMRGRARQYRGGVGPATALLSGSRSEKRWAGVGPLRGTRSAGIGIGRRWARRLPDGVIRRTQLERAAMQLGDKVRKAGNRPVGSGAVREDRILGGHGVLVQDL